jgi:hypothetical protein
LLAEDCIAAGAGEILFGNKFGMKRRYRQ